MRELIVIDSIVELLDVETKEDCSQKKFMFQKRYGTSSPEIHGCGGWKHTGPTGAIGQAACGRDRYPGLEDPEGEVCLGPQG